MKHRRYYHQLCCFTVALLAAFTAHSQTKVDGVAFKPQVAVEAAPRMSVRLTKSDTIPLQDFGIIYAFSIDATVTQPRESSFCRIVLEDKEGRNYLVAETDRFRNDSETVRLDNYCEETALLEGITPLRLKCYLSGDASVNITGVHTSTHHLERAISDIQTAKAELRTAQVQSIVDSINAYNVRHGKLWRAGVTEYSLRTIEERNDVGDADPYATNMMYYVDGIYEIGERDLSRTVTSSNFVESFDWRNRHGRNWITPVRDQLFNGPCMIFATVGVAEALTNLYYNDNTINEDLSEWFVYGYKYGFHEEYIPSILDPMMFLVTDSVIDESSCPYGIYFNYSLPRPIGQESIRLPEAKAIYKSNYIFETFMDSIKYNLIHYGPASWGSKFPNNANYLNHYMTLVGWGTASSGDTCTVITSNSSTVITIPYSMSGQTYWIFKNSFGDTQAHYINIIFNDVTKATEQCCFAAVPIISRQLAERNVNCEDLDGDGYFNWGIGERPDSLLPAWAEFEPDGDDINDTIGSLNSYGYPNTLYYGWNDDEGYILVSTNQTDSSHSFHRGAIEISANTIYTITGTKVMHPQARLYLNNGAVLVVDGGVLVNPSFEFYGTGSVILRNGGKIVHTQQMPSFTFPVGLNLIIESGDIRYVQRYW